MNFPLYFRNFIKFEVDGEQTLGEYTVIVTNSKDYTVLQKAKNNQLSTAEENHTFAVVEGFVIKAVQIAHATELCFCDSIGFKRIGFAPEETREFKGE